jgi:hypothetical protein
MFRQVQSKRASHLEATAMVAQNAMKMPFPIIVIYEATVVQNAHRDGLERRRKRRIKAHNSTKSG